MTNLDSEIIRNAVEYNYKDEVAEMSEKLRDEIKKLGPEQKICLKPEIDGDVLGNDDDEIIFIMSERLIKYKIKEKAFEVIMNEGLIHPTHTCEEGYSIVKNFHKADGTGVSGRFNFRRMIYDEFITI